jgi:hypothetical protein
VAAIYRNETMEKDTLCPASVVVNCPKVGHDGSHGDAEAPSGCRTDLVWLEFRFTHGFEACRDEHEAGRLIVDGD